MYENFKTGFLDHPLSKLQYFPHDKKELTILLLGRMCQMCQEGEKSLGRPVSVKDPMFLIFPVLVCTSFFLYSVVIFHWMSCVYLSVSLSVVNNKFFNLVSWKSDHIKFIGYYFCHVDCLNLEFYRLITSCWLVNLDMITKDVPVGHQLLNQCKIKSWLLADDPVANNQLTRWTEVPLAVDWINAAEN